MKPCACGIQFTSNELSGAHKRQCPAQRAAIIADVRRIATVLGHTPRMKEYDALKAPGMPWANNLVPQYWLLWNDVITAAGLTPVRTTPTPAPAATVAPIRYWWQLEKEALQAYGY